MANQSSEPLPCEVILLTALPVEFQAVIWHVQDVQEVVHPSGTIYHWGTFAGTQQTWRIAVAEIGMGGTTAATEAEKAIQFFHPHIALFVGVAGGLKDVQRGDVVVATKVYAYEAGKAGSRFEPRPSLGHASHALEQRARAEAHSKEWLARLEGNCPDPAPQVFIGAMAAGEKVLSSTKSSLARFLKTTYGDALAIEMEGHGFLHAVRLNHTVHGLVIRGISDLIDDKTVADASGTQSMAAHHAAAFAFQVLAKFTLSVPNSTSSPPPSSKLWQLPYLRNPVFTGREELLTLLTTVFHTEHAAVLFQSQAQAITGLGGVGKTQLAIEYAYRRAQHYQHIFWVNAATQEALISGYTRLAEALKLEQRHESDQAVIVDAVRQWLQTHNQWLLILDNSDDLSLTQSFLPPRYDGHILLTTRASATGRFAHRIEINTLSNEEGALLLLRRAKILTPQGKLEEADKQERALARILSAELGDLPLALDQAGAYIEETQCSLISYHQQYQTRRAELLARRGTLGDDHPESVTTTWLLSFARVEAANPTAAKLLQICAFLAPDSIPEELLEEALKLPFSTSKRRGWRGKFSRLTSGHWKEQKSALSAELTGKIDEAMALLRSYSLIQRNATEKTVQVHQLVQAVTRDAMPKEVERMWGWRIIQAIHKVLPEIDASTWLECEKWLKHAFMCVHIMKEQELKFAEAFHVLYWTGAYLLERRSPQEAGPMLQQALAWQEHALGPEHPDTAATLDRLATFFEFQGRYREAEAFYHRALTTYEQQFGLDHPHTAYILSNLAGLYWKQGRYLEAEAFYQRALATYEQQFGLDHPHTANTLNDLALLYTDQGKYTEAEMLYKRVLTIHEQQFGLDHPRTAIGLNNLANLYWNQGRYAEAEPFYLRTLDIRERLLGSEHFDTSTSLNNLATLYHRQGKYEKAEPLFRRALAIREQQFGIDHLNTAIGLNNLANLYWKQGKYVEAESLYRRALAIWEQQLENNHPLRATGLDNLANLYQDQRKYLEAEPLYQRALAIREVALGLEHPATAKTRTSYIALLHILGREAEARQLEGKP